MIQTQILWVGEIRAMADLIIWYIEDLIDGLRLPTNKAEVDLFNYVIKSRLKEIVRQHNLMYRSVTGILFFIFLLYVSFNTNNCLLHFQTVLAALF